MSLLSSLEHYDELRNNGTGVRKGNLEVIEGEEVAICNLAALVPFSMPSMDGMPPMYLTDLFGTVATQLALAVHHLNTGDGRIVRDVEGLNERCNVRFTLEFLDTGLAENVAVDQVIKATDRGVQRAVRELKESQYQYIFAVLNNNQLMEQVLVEAYHQEIAGTGTHTWLFSDASLGAILEGKFQVDSPLHKALRGTGVLMASAGLTDHVPTLKAYYDNLNEIAQNPADIDYLIRKSPNPDAFATSDLAVKFDTNDPYAPFIYDSIIALGLGACNAAKEDGYSFTGAEHFRAMTHTTFLGTSGPVVLNAETGSREPSSTYYGLYQVVSNTDNNTTYQVTMSSLFDHGTWRELEPFVYADGSTEIPSDLPGVNLNPNYLSTGWRIAGWVLCGLGVALALGFALWTYLKARRKDRVVTASQPFFLYLICFGVATFFAAIVPLGVDEQIASTEGCTIACNAVPWLLSVGFCVTFSALFTKTQRVNKIFKSARFTRIKVTPLDVVKPMLLCLGANILLLILMTVIMPISWTVQVLQEDPFHRPTETWGFCNWSDSIPFLVSLAAINLGCLLYAMIQAYEAREISIEFAESEYIFRCMLVISLSAFLGFPVLLLIHDNNNAFYFFFSALIFVTGSMVLSLIFVPKIRFIQLKEKQPEESHRLSIMGGAGSSRLFNSTSSSSYDEGLRVLRHPKTEAELRERVADLEGRLRKFAERYSACGPSGSEDNLSAPLNGQEHALDSVQTCSSTPEDRPKASTGDSVSTEPRDDEVRL